VPIDSPRDAVEFTDRVLYEPYWLTGHNKDYEVDPEGATEALLNAFDTTFCQYREISRCWIVIHSNSKVAVEQARKQEEAYQNFKFMTVDDFKSKIMAR
jgi:hypothetical protein